MTRRQLLALGVAGTATAASKRLRISAIGHTGRGNYGHGLDVVWKAFDSAEIVAVCSETDGHWTTEMIVGTYQSQVSGRPLNFPLADRRHPLA